MVLTRCLVHRIRHQVHCRSNKQKNKFIIRNKPSNSSRKPRGERAFARTTAQAYEKILYTVFWKRVATETTSERQISTNKYKLKTSYYRIARYPVFFIFVSFDLLFPFPFPVAAHAQCFALYTNQSLFVDLKGKKSSDEKQRFVRRSGTSRGRGQLGFPLRLL